MDIQKSIKGISLKTIVISIIALIVGFVMIQNCYRKEKLNNVPLTQIKSNDVANKAKINEIEEEINKTLSELLKVQNEKTYWQNMYAKSQEENKRLKTRKYESGIHISNYSDKQTDSLLTADSIKYTKIYID